MVNVPIFNGGRSKGRIMQADADLLSPEEKTEIEQHMAALLQAKELTDAKAVEEATERLAQVTEPFAARRMNKGIQSALAGQNIESI